VEEISRNAIERRYRLMPYLYTLFHEASQNGMPVMRPLFFADPDDPDLRDEQEAFLWGEKLMIVPRWAEDTDLPEGNWKSFTLLEKSPYHDQYQPTLKIKAGSIIPAGPVIQHTEDYATDSLTLMVSLDENQRASGTLYEDKGNGFGYKKGEYLESWFHAQQTGNSLKVQIRHKQGKWELPGDRTYRIQLVTDEGTFFSEWMKGYELKMQMP